MSNSRGIENMVGKNKNLVDNLNKNKKVKKSKINKIKSKIKSAQDNFNDLLSVSKRHNSKYDIVEKD